MGEKLIKYESLADAIDAAALAGTTAAAQGTAAETKGNTAAAQGAATAAQGNTAAAQGNAAAAQGNAAAAQGNAAEAQGNAAGLAAANADARYMIAAGVDGLVGASETVLRVVPAEPITIPAGMVGSTSYAGVTPTAQRIWSVKKNGVEFGTITWNIGSSVATFAAASATTFNGTTDRLSVVASATGDATLADVTFTIRGATT